MRRRISLALLLTSVTAATGLAVGAVGCSDDGDDGPTPPDPAGEETLVHGLTEAQAAQVLAKVGPTEITVGAFAEELASKGSFIRTRYASPERRREFLDQMIRFELLAQEAHRRGYDELPDVRRARKQMMIRRFLEQRFDSEGPEAIAAEDVASYYEAHRREFNTPAQVRASHILVRDRAAAQRLLREILAAPDDLALWRRLTEQNNTDPATRDRLGDLRFFSRPDERTEDEPEVPAPVATAAFTIERIGGVHPEVIESDQGFHILKLTGRRAAMSRSLAESDRPIRNRIFRERREAAIESLISELRAESDVEEDLSLLDEIELRLPDGDSPTIAPPTANPFNPHQPAPSPAPAPTTDGVTAPAPPAGGTQ